MTADPEPSPSRRPRASVLVPWMLAPACLLVAGWTFARYFVLESENRTLAQREALLLVTLRSAETRLEAEQIVGERVVTELQKTNAASREVAPLVPAAGRREPFGAITWSTTRPDGLFVAHALTPTAGGEHYELWLTAPKRMRVGRFTVAADGAARVPLTVADPLPADAEFSVYRAPKSEAGEPTEVVLRTPDR